ncbi:hypothetical protein T01_3102 [Trichinella spiralis]|uniref:Uncharacterized protein n=2 Tax=Trichinella spiralis TaxID=6334 RepID=A0A0V1BLS5_TRISP|nr:hypothetical protein T01_3102 [Trichinella spiralis]
MKRFLLISLIFNITFNICEAIKSAEEFMCNFKMMVQDWFNECHSSNRYYVVRKIKGTVLYNTYMSTEFEFKRSNCTKKERPPYQVREKYGCFPIDSDDLKHIKKCTVLHSGCLIALKSLNNFATQCHSADISAMLEIENLFPSVI